MKPDEMAPTECRQAFEELKLLQDSMLRIWQIYINWYTWFVGTSVLALSWMIARPGATSSELIKPLAVFLTIACVLGMGAGGAVGWHRKLMQHRAAVLAAMIGPHKFHPAIFLGDAITLLAVGATIITLFALFVVWGGVALGYFTA